MVLVLAEHAVLLATQLVGLVLAVRQLGRRLDQHLAEPTDHPE